MQFNQTNVLEEAPAQVNIPMDQIYYNQVLRQTCSAIPDRRANWETLLQRESVEMQFNQTYVLEEAPVEANIPMDQIYCNEVLRQTCSAIPDCPAALETLLQTESVEMQFNQMYLPGEASVEVSKPTDQISNNQVLKQNCSAIHDCPAALETLLRRESVEMQFNQTYVLEEAPVEANIPMDQIYCNEVLRQTCSAIPDCPAALETLLQTESVEMQFNQMYLPDEASVEVSKPTD